MFDFACFVIAAQDKNLAFLTAEGFWKYTSGERGGNVWIVKNLNYNGPDSLKEAIEANGSIIITFGILGNTPFKSVLEIKHGALNIVKQSTPGDGIR
ncbi:MAG: hypothetical protein KTR26_18345 [Flammeovirgaceae bacterium]|nr:hypothetical protein [Flammeovirgaceae bacterium]